MRLGSVLSYVVCSVMTMILPLEALADRSDPEATEMQTAPGILKLETVLQSTLATHPALKAQMREQTAADADLLSSKGAFDPQIVSEALSRPESGYSGTYGSVYVEQPIELFGGKVVAGHRMGRGLFPTYEDYYNTSDEGEVGVGVEIPLLRDGPIDRRRADIQKARFGQDIAGASVEQKKIDLTRNAALIYWQWVASANKVRVYRELLRVAEQRNRQITERVNRGDLPDFDRIDNNRAVQQRKAQLLTAEQTMQSAAFQLSLFFRDSTGHPLEVTNYTAPTQVPKPQNLRTMTIEEALQEALFNRPEFEYLQAQREQNEVEITLAKNQINPRVDVKVFGVDDLGQAQTRGEEPELKAGLRIEIPLATRKQRGKRSFYEAKQEKLSLSTTFLQEQIRADIQDAINALDIAKQTVEVIANEVTAAQRLATGERQRFELGDSNLIFVNLREQNAADAEVRQLDALFRYQKAKIVLDSVLGRIQGGLS